MRQVPIRTTFQRLDLAFIIDEGSTDLEHRDGRSCRITFDLPTDFITGNIWQLYIQDHQVRLGLDAFQSLTSGGTLLDRQIGALENAGNHISVLLVVVNEKNSRAVKRGHLGVAPFGPVISRVASEFKSASGLNVEVTSPLLISLAPILFRNCFSFGDKAFEVYTMTGSVLVSSLPLSCSRTSKPVKPGMTRSRMTASGRSVFTRSSASVPLCAWTNCSHGRSINSRRIWSERSLSSTSKSF